MVGGGAPAAKRGGGGGDDARAALAPRRVVSVRVGALDRRVVGARGVHPRAHAAPVGTRGTRACLGLGLGLGLRLGLGLGFGLGLAFSEAKGPSRRKKEM